MTALPQDVRICPLSLQAKGIAILMIEHHQEALFQICDRVCVLQNGTFQAKKVN